MSDQTSLENRDLLKQINGKLAWICFFLILIVLNTCELSVDVEDAIRDRADAEAPAAATPAAPTQES